MLPLPSLLSPLPLLALVALAACSSPQPPKGQAPGSKAPPSSTIKVVPPQPAKPRWQSVPAKADGAVVPGGRRHIVKRGETGIAIARAYGVGWSRIAEANGIPRDATINVGQTLFIPTGGSATAARPPQSATAPRPQLRPGVAIGVLTADCAPLLFEEVEAGVIGAAHAGWKGAFTGVIGATVDLMVKLGARRDRIAAAVGPCIARRSYEVDEAFRARFETADVENGAFFTDGRAGHAFFDLEGYCLSRLAAAGVTRAEGLGADTKADEARFFSYRRTTLARERDYGRQLSLIALSA